VADIEAALEISEVKASAKAYVSLDARLVAMEEENDKLRERLLICEEELNTLRKRCDNEETKRERLEVNVLRMWGTSTMFDRSLEELSKRLALLESFLIDSGQ